MKKLLIVLLVLGLTFPAMAAELKFSGSVRTMISYVLSDDDTSAVTGSTGEGEFDGSKGIIDIPSGTFNSLRANIAMNEKASGYLHFGADQRGNSETKPDENGVIKQYYIKYNFGPGELRFGHMEGIITNGTNLPMTTADGGPWVGYTFYKTRTPTILLNIGDFTVGLAKNMGGPGVYLRTPDDFPDRDAVIPEIDLIYSYKSDWLSVKATGGFQTYAVQNENDSATINSYAGSLSAKGKFGPVWAGVTGYYTQNPNNMGFGFGGPIWGRSGSLIGAANVNADGSVDDATLYGCEIGAGFKFNPKINLDAGFVYNNSQRDNVPDDDMMGWYVNAPISIGGGIVFIPEIGQFLWGDLGDKNQGNTMYFSGTFSLFW